MSPAAQLDVALIAGRAPATIATAAASAGTPRVFAEVEVALDTPDATGAERVADLARYASWTDRGRLRHVCSADGLVAALDELSRHVDGVRLHPLVLDEDLPVLSRLVLPALSARRLVARPLPGTSLRSALGPERPANRFAAAAVQEETR
ncbi:hypothetical protein ACFV2H_44235 [Streptomyces sp. NPDC059629]|uniref:hypothetical protein n=1 Tax=Streptomyces sp. NPDC059629 TaxID=3346889 RepID=UPI00368DEB09